MTSGFFTLGELFVEIGYPFHARGFGVGGCPLSEEDRTFILHLGVGEGVGGCHPQAFEQRFVGEGSLEPRSSVLNETIEDGQGA